MNKIFFDIGNSFIKWATIVDGYYEYYAPIRMETLLAEGLEILELDKTFNEVYFSSVAHANHIDEFKSLIQSSFKVLPIQLTSQKRCCGLESGYKDFSKLGDDRWLAMLGAVELYQQPVIVIDAGTALTIDAIVNGQHQGGFIVPGLHTMRKSLSLSTADLSEFSMTDLADDQKNTSQELLATETTAAILGGTLYMTAAFVNQVIADLNQQLATQFKVIITGGDASQITSLIDADYEHIPDLVLQGMVFVEESVKKQ